MNVQLSSIIPFSDNPAPSVVELLTLHGMQVFWTGYVTCEVVE